MTANKAPDLHTVSDRLAKNAMRHASERIIEMLLFAAAAVSVLTTVGIVYVLVTESINFFQNVSIVDFLTDTQWTPLFDDAHFGIMVLISGTVVSSAVALTVAIPMGTVIAIYLSEFAKPKVREIAKPIIRWEDSPQLGYEILPNKYFYRYQPPKPAKELLAEFWRLEKEAEKMLEGLAK